jgi:hypothetical protein
MDGWMGRTATYDCESPYYFAWWVDVAVYELADEVRRQADYGYHGDYAEAAGDEEGFC